MLSEFLVTKIACPRCKGPLRATEDLVCDPCAVTYPVRNGIPLLLRHELCGPVAEDRIVDRETSRKKAEAAFFSSVPYEDYYEGKRSSTAEESPYWKKVSARVRGILSILPREAAILDVGGSTRTFIEEFNLADQTAVIDISEGFLRKLPAFRNRIGADFEELPFLAETFDVIFVHGILHHCPNQEGALGEAARVMKPGGWIVIIEPSKWSLALVYYLVKRGIVLAFGPRMLRSWFHYHGTPDESYVDARMLRRVFVGQGFRIELEKSSPLRLPYVGKGRSARWVHKIGNFIEETWFAKRFGSYLIAEISKAAKT